VDAHNGGLAAQNRALRLKIELLRLKIEPWRIYSPVVANSHHFDEGQDPDPDPH
jgi:hypothetical protein